MTMIEDGTGWKQCTHRHIPGGVREAADAGGGLPGVELYDAKATIEEYDLDWFGRDFNAVDAVARGVLTHREARERAIGRAMKDSGIHPFED